MKKWEYNIQTIGDAHEQPVAVLEIFGHEGWELISVVRWDDDNCKYYFKREKREIIEKAEPVSAD